ncbi:hypothetical protein HYH02_010261 [Chlamydomonas schloesseri]|uniref:Uncharacterized protein n=1 Tax=Chlamydomonas schloesseri TaxID=2026947 RepID=A0A835W4W0_9CHLO|nr:hypothetical protein HYH02_010261 [Chlamydomonas schloesseri]|eukprot:KAG2440682.1 hypothetical protein HYH02_010261 [Chlamydomonas schloesseri]
MAFWCRQRCFRALVLGHQRVKTWQLGPEASNLRHGWGFWEPHWAVQPWPAYAFTAHWGLPEPWRALSGTQRQRLLCLAASSGDAGSLDAALTHHGGKLTLEVLTAAAAAGRTAACARLLGAGCPGLPGAIQAAARGGHIATVELLLRAAAQQHTGGGAASSSEDGSSADLLAAVQAAAAGAGQAVLYVWLQQAHSYSPSPLDAAAAARGGHTALLQQLLPRLPQLMTRPAPGEADPADVEAVAAADEFGLPAATLTTTVWRHRWLLLWGIAYGCPVELFRRHLDTLWRWPLPEDVVAEPAARQGDVAGAGGATFAPPDEAELHGIEEQFRMDTFMATADRLEYDSLLMAAAASPTACWAEKVNALLCRWGRTAALRTLVRLRFWCHHPDYWQRLQHLGALGLHVHDRGLERLAAHGARFTARSVACGAAASWSEESLLWLMTQVAEQEGGGATAGEGAGAGAGAGAGGDAAAGVSGSAGTVDEAQKQWSLAFTYAARDGASMPVLQALRARGAAIDLLAVAEGGSITSLEWAVAQLEQERGGILPVLGPVEVATILRHASPPALQWLRARGLSLTPPAQPPDMYERVVVPTRRPPWGNARMMP